LRIDHRFWRSSITRLYGGLIGGCTGSKKLYAPVSSVYGDGFGSVLNSEPMVVSQRTRSVASEYLEWVVLVGIKAAEVSTGKEWHEHSVAAERWIAHAVVQV